MCDSLLILAKNYGDEAVFIPYGNVGAIRVVKGGITDTGEQHYSVVFCNKEGNILATNEGFPSFERAVQSVKMLGIKIVENK